MAKAQKPYSDNYIVNDNYWGQSGGKKSPFGGKNSQKVDKGVGKYLINKLKNYGSVIKL